MMRLTIGILLRPVLVFVWRHHRSKAATSSIPLKTVFTCQPSVFPSQASSSRTGSCAAASSGGIIDSSSSEHSSRTSSSVNSWVCSFSNIASSDATPSSSTPIGLRPTWRHFQNCGWVKTLTRASTSAFALWAFCNVDPNRNLYRVESLLLEGTTRAPASLAYIFLATTSVSHCSETRAGSLKPTSSKFRNKTGTSKALLLCAVRMPLFELPSKYLLISSITNFPTESKRGQS
mmetsp:Transcript_5241/g.14716  ORF Transcript_5241/g.14716 Transcript_5241/m.14716 type:complete len:233 (+) Transcript_5241:4464-5162(+)